MVLILQIHLLEITTWVAGFTFVFLVVFVQKQICWGNIYRVFVNSGKKVDFTWVDWDYSTPFLKNAVDVDKRSELKVATFLDSSNNL